MTPIELKKIFIESIERRAKSNLAGINNFWNCIDNFFKKSHISLSVIGESIAAAPENVINKPDFQPVILAQLLQHLNYGKGENYQYMILNKGYAFSDFDAREVQNLCAVKNRVGIDRMYPFNFMHDINLYRLSLPFDAFYDMQINNLNKEPKYNREEKFQRQIAFFQFLLSRPSIYSTMDFENSFNGAARFNLMQYVKMEDSVLDALSGIEN